jgi:hypothetical protein
MPNTLEREARLRILVSTLIPIGSHLAQGPYNWERVTAIW